MQKYVLVDVIPPTQRRDDAEEELEETVSLINTLKKGKIIEIIQRRANPHPGLYVGMGKALEIADMIKSQNIDVVILDTIAKPIQLFKLTKMLWKANPNIEVWDRVDLILHIFEKHARTAEAKMQIELARMRHMGPRMYGLGGELGRQAGGIGGRGIGETNIELMKRHWRSEIKNIKEKLEKQQKIRLHQMNRRERKGFQTVAIVGYTNAGKTSLFNVLTKKDKKSKDELFATLDSTVGEIFFPEKGKKLLVSDTIGFIKNLPPNLIDAFKSTLMESIHANLLIHVVDISDGKLFEKIKIVNEILNDIQANGDQLLVFNKIDRVEEEVVDYMRKKYADRKISFVSAHEEKGIKELKSKIAAQLLS